MPPVPARDAEVGDTAGGSPASETRDASVDLAGVKQLVRSAILRGLCLDDPWRHAYLRDRWIGRAG
jgi:hypothetical protein